MSPVSTKRPPTLTGGQRRQLRALAHHLDPLVKVGKGGLTDDLFDAVDRALTDHELVKVRVLESAPVDRKEAGAALADRVAAHDLGVVGRIVLLYRRHPDAPRVQLRGR